MSFLFPGQKYPNFQVNNMFQRISSYLSLSSTVLWLFANICLAGWAYSWEVPKAANTSDKGTDSKPYLNELPFIGARQFLSNFSRLLLRNSDFSIDIPKIGYHFREKKTFHKYFNSNQTLFFQKKKKNTHTHIYTNKRVIC